MGEVVIRVSVTEQQAIAFAGRDMMVTPLSEVERQQLMVALAGLTDATENDGRTFGALLVALAPQGEAASEVAAAVTGMAERNRRSAEMVEYVRVILGRSALVGRDELDGKVLQ